MIIYCLKYLLLLHQVPLEIRVPQLRNSGLSVVVPTNYKASQRVKWVISGW